MNALEEIKQFTVYFATLPKNIELIVKNQLDLSIRSYLSSLSSSELYKKISSTQEKSLPVSTSKPATSQFFKFDSYSRVTIKKQVDADTYDVQFQNGQRERIRIAGVDAPEKNTLAGQRAIKASQAFFAGTPENTHVLLNSSDKYDMYNRKVAKLSFKHRDLTTELLKSRNGDETALAQDTVETKIDPTKEEIDALENYIRTAAVMELYKLSYDFVAHITSDRIRVNSVNQIVEQAVKYAVDNVDTDLGKSLNSFIKLVSMTIYKKFSSRIVNQVNKEVAAHINKLFR